MISIIIDGVDYQTQYTGNLLSVCLSLGLDIPYFCWHPALGSVGSCRQCAIKCYDTVDDVQGRLVMSCMTLARDGMRISINDTEAVTFRKHIAELFMLNHPHDCPVCEEGGNCHLQDVTVMTGQCVRRYRFPKRQYYNQYLGPFVSHEMNRCITCYRCLRYYKDYADGKDFGVFGVSNRIYFGRCQDGILESEFSGNLIEICPTGVFTDKTSLNNYSRKWDAQYSPSICQQCCIGCNIIIGERYGTLCRIENRYNGNINGYFLCDRGRFSYDYVNFKDRPKRPLYKQDDHWIYLDIKQALQKASDILHKSNRIIGIGSARASIESNFALRKLVGADNFCTGINYNEQSQLLLILDLLNNSGANIPSIREIESYDAILILGEDVTQTGARIALAIRQAIKNKAKKIAESQHISDWQISSVMDVAQDSKYPLFITNIDVTKLDDISAWTYYAALNDQAYFGFTIANIIDHAAPLTKDIDKFLYSKACLVAHELLIATKPLIITGTQAGNDINIISAAANIVKALQNNNKDVGIVFVVAEANSIGLSMIDGINLDNILNQSQDNLIDCLIILENDLYRKGSLKYINSCLDKIENIIIIDHQYNILHEKANLILPASVFAESDGTLINYEGRAQRFFKCYLPNYYDKELLLLDSWRWLYLLYDQYLDNQDVKHLCIDNVIDELIHEFPELLGIKKVAPDASYRILGQKLSRSPHRYSGRTSMYANINVHESSVPYDADSMFTFSMEGNSLPQSPHQHIAFAWSPGWNSVQSWNKFQDEVGGHLCHGDPGIKLFNNKLKLFGWLNYKVNIYDNIMNKKNNHWHIVPYWHLFGSEEMSQRSYFIKQAMLDPYVILNKQDAKFLGINDNMMFLLFYCDDQEFKLLIKFSDVLVSGYIGLPIGFPGIPLSLVGKEVNNLHAVFK